MLEREEVMAEFWRRMASVEGVKYTARNPIAPPSADDVPIIQFFELGDRVESSSSRGGYPAHIRRLSVIAEVFIKAESEASSTKELGLFVQKVKKALFVGGDTTLGKKCVGLLETESGRILRPLVGGSIIGVGLAFDIRYIENIQRLFV